MRKVLLSLVLTFSFFLGFSQWTQTNGPEGGDLGEIVQVNSSLFMSAGDGGIYKSVDYGSSWEMKTIVSVDRIQILDLVTDQGVLYASVDLKGVYKSQDEGENWTLLGFEEKTFLNIMVDGPNIYGAEIGGGITYSNDAGATWVHAGGVLDEILFTDFAVFNSSVYAVSSQDGAFFESSDNGSTWNSIEIPEVGAFGVKNILALDNVLVVSSDFEVFISTDNLVSWTKLSLNTAATIVKMKTFNNQIYVLTHNRKIFSTNDLGSTWDEKTNSTSNIIAMDLFVKENRIIVSSVRNLYESHDNGQTWDVNNTGIKSSGIRSLIVANDELITGTHGQGVYKSNDLGQSWTAINNGLNESISSDIYEMIEVDDAIYIAEIEGIYVTNDMEASWQKTAGAGLTNIPTELVHDNEVFLSVSYSDGLLKSIDNCETWTKFPNLPFAIDKTIDALWYKDGTILLSNSDHQIFISNNDGATWTDISIDEYYNGVTNFKLIGDRLYVGTYSGLFVSDNLGESWERLNGMYAPVRDILVNSDTIYVATNYGFYVTREDLNEWYRINENIGNVVLTSLAIKEDMLYAGTSSSGVWKIPISEVLAILPEPDPSDLALRINTGGLEIDYNNETFLTDNYFDTGNTLDRPQTGLPEPYQTFRFSRSRQMSYDIPLEDGEYTVNLYFAELWFGATGGGSGGIGSRVFDVGIEGQLAEDNLDVFAEAGADAMLMKSHTVTVIDGELNIDFDSRDAVGGERHPIINAIEILGTGPQEQRPFVTTWKTDNPGVSEDNQITIPTYPGETYDYNVDWGDGTSDAGVTGDITHTYAAPGIYQVSIFADFSRIQFPVSGGDNDKLISIDQWGDTQWSSMHWAFFNCTNLDVIATDIPDFSLVEDTSSMFSGCASLEGNGSFSDWQVSQVVNMSAMFFNAEIFNQDIGGWNVSNVVNMNGMFSGSRLFNSAIGNWNVSNVLDMGAMFYRALSFNQNISEWDVSSVMSMSSMFNGSSSFNQNLDSWDVSNVIEMNAMFQDALYFDQNISNWDVSKVTDTGMMFRNATAFDQNLASWDISAVTYMLDMFRGAYLSTDNYDNMLIGWSELQLQNGVNFHGGNSQYCLGETARQTLIDDFGWIITDSGKAADCPDITSFITTWKTDNPGVSEDNQITIPTFPGETYDYTVDWGDGLSDSGVTGDITHNYANSGTYQVSISGIFPRFYMGFGQTDNNKILSVDQWGDIEWSSMEYAFPGCSYLDIKASDAPDLTQVISAQRMFNNCESLIGNASFGEWDVSNVADMHRMFASTQFNQDIGAWNVSNVTQMLQMFLDTPFNQDIGDWNVTKVYNMGGMFRGTPFNQDISTWNVGNVELMGRMFANSLFNQDIGNWDVGNVQKMDFMFEGSPFNQDISNWNTESLIYANSMFSGATSFDQDLGAWNIGNVTGMQRMFAEITLSNENYDGILNGWSSQNVQSSVEFDGGQSQYCESQEARQRLTDSFGWLIVDGGKRADCDIIGPGSDFALRFNTGGEQVVYNGDTFLADNNFVGDSNVLSRPQTGLPEPYQTFRYSPSQQMSYNIPIENGEYNVNLYFAELWFGATGGGSGGVGSRVFDINIEGELAEDNLDVFAEVGADAMLVKTHTVTITDGELNIDFDSRDAVGGERHPIINAIEILGEISEPVERPFVTTWKTDNPGTSQDNQITIPTFPGETYNYSVDWGDGTSDSGVAGDVAHTYAAPGTYQVSISSEFPRIYFNGFGDDLGDARKLISIEQWGNQQWSSMLGAFAGCANLDMQANDIPDFSALTSLVSMFRFCSSFVGNSYIGEWDVSNVTSMSNLFDGATLFNQDISNWDVSNVINMNYMFNGASSFNKNIGDWDVSKVKYMSSTFIGARIFNQDIGNWDVSNVVEMHAIFAGASAFNQDIGRWNLDNVTRTDAMFSGATAFNQDISNWNVANVTTMNVMFASAESFNQDIGNWDVSNVTDMRAMFDGAIAFNQPINNWDVSNVSKMSSMFVNATSFNRPLDLWDVSKVTTTSGMFLKATSFNQDLSSWNTSNVTSIGGMFNQAISFDQSLGEWKVGMVAEMDYLFNGTGLSTENYDRTLIGWSTQELQSGVTLQAGNSQYCLGEAARQKLIDDFGWTITDGGKTADCPEPRPFVTTWKTDNPGISEDNQITIPTFSDETYDYSVDWGDGTSDSGVTGNITHAYTTPGTYQVSISGDFPRIYFNNGSGIDSFSDASKLLLVEQWGDLTWSSMSSAFNGCKKLDVTALDYPNMTEILDLSYMFGRCVSLTGNSTFGNWDVSGVTNMSNLFAGASSFNNEGVIDWDTSNVTNMSNTFNGCTTFNQNIGSWDTSKVERMDAMFFQALSFNQDISEWEVSKVSDMYVMFEEATSFNQDIGNWDVSNVTIMADMFGGASSFNQNLGNWDISKAGSLHAFIAGTALSNENYDKMLIGWSQLPSLQNDVQLVAQNQYCSSEDARQSIIDTYGWTISDDGWAADCQDTTSFITTWKTDNPGISEDNQITIPTFQGETYDYTVDWGDGTSDSGVTGDITHTFATPGIYQVSISGEFPRIYFNSISTWGIFGDEQKILSIDQWGDIMWTSMANSFRGCTNVNMLATDIPDFTNTSSLEYMFNECHSLVANESLNSWDVSTIVNLEHTFSEVPLFNIDISNWDVSNVERMFATFFDAQSFNQDIGNWNVGKAKIFTYMFYGAESFNRDIGNWNMTSASDLRFMFENATSFNQNIGDWNVSNVSDMSSMFKAASSFNQNIGNWDVSNVTNMNGMFATAYDFNQNLGNWVVSNVVDMHSMFYGATLSVENYDKTLIGWNNLPTLQNDVVLHIASEYCSGEEARQSIIDTYNWTFADGGKAADCPEPNDFALRINTGGSGVDYNGETYVGDTYFDTGLTLDRPQTGLPEPYQTFRYSRSQQMSYDIPIPDGEYMVKLHFAELWFGATGGGAGGVESRVFDVSIEGQLAEDNLDIFSEVGADAMLIKAYTVTVTGGTLDIDFDSRDAVGGERHPVINAIEILGTSGGGSGKLAIGKKQDDNSMTLYPNQVSDFATVSFEKPTEVQQIYVFDMIGRLIQSYNPKAIRNGDDYTIDVNLYQQGAYIIKMIDNKGINFQKQMVVKRE